VTSPSAPALQRANKIKQAVTEELLTADQQRAIDAILEHRENREQYINLYGPSNTGKSFLAWVLSEQHGWGYYQSLAEDVGETVAIFDHGKPDRDSTRDLRRHSRLTGLATILYITNKPATEVYPRVTLDPSAEHYNTIESNWETIGLNTNQAPTEDQ
jgi:replication-associated recombination protein RarA